MTRTKRKRVLLPIWSRIIVTMLLVGICINSQALQVVYAAEAGTAYIAATRAYYAHPITGKIEDSGNNEAIGQGMTESVTNTQALIEVTESNNLYATIRLSMMDNLSNVQFWTQERGDTGWDAASYDIMQENTDGDYTSDFRFQIPSQDTIIRASFYVGPMGRDITYYIAFLSFSEGSGDFVVSINNEEESQPLVESTAIQSEEKTAEDTVTQDSSTKSSNNNDVFNSSTTATSGLTEKTKEILNTSGIMTGAQLIENADGLVLSDDTLLQSKLGDTVQAEMTQIEENSIQALPWMLVFQVILIITIPAIVIGSFIVLLGAVLHRRERDES